MKWKFSLAWVRVSVLCILVMMTVFFISRQSGVEKFLQRIMTPSLASADKNWRLELNKTFILCGHHQIHENRYSTLKELQAAITGNREYNLRKISGHRYFYETLVQDYCFDCQNHQFLGISDQNVAVIRGNPDKPGPILEKTPIRVEALPLMELEDLRKGIPFKTGNEKLQLIEGLKSLNAN